MTDFRQSPQLKDRVSDEEVVVLLLQGKQSTLSNSRSDLAGANGLRVQGIRDDVHADQLSVEAQVGPSGV